MPLVECAACGERGMLKTLTKCDRCKSVYYCNGDCQAKHLKAGHEKECKEIAEVMAAKEAKAIEAMRNRCRDCRGPCRCNDRRACRNAPAIKGGTLTMNDIEEHVIPSVEMCENGEVTMNYRDEREGNPIKMMTGGAGTAEMKLRLRPVEVEDVPSVPQPASVIKALDVDGDDAFTKEEQVAIMLNSFNVRCYVQKRQQLDSNMFVLLVEYDVREGYTDSTLCLTVTTLSDGMGDETTFPTSRRRFLFHAPRSNASDFDFDPESSPKLPSDVTNSFSNKRGGIIRGLVPVGIDFVLNHPDYKSMLAKARDLGKRILLQLRCRSPILAARGEGNSTDAYCTNMLYWIQGLIHRGYGYSARLSRLPDGYTGEEVDRCPESVVRTMRRLEEEGRFVDQPLLVTDEERCVPRETHDPTACRLSMDDLPFALG